VEGRAAARRPLPLADELGAQEIDCRYDGIKGLVLRAEFVRKR
jgi:uncharacterized Zn ribbon protein